MRKTGSLLKNVIFIGPPGSGKGTYARDVAQRLSMVHISTGDALRQEINNKSELGTQVKQYTDAGDRVPDTLMETFVHGLLNSAKGSGYILDGFPRTLPQAKFLDGITQVDAVVHIQMPEDFLIRKLAGRRVCKECGISWNVEDIDEGDFKMPAMLPPKECESKLFVRDDDKIDVIKHRISEYVEQEKPLLEYYNQFPGLVRRIPILGGKEKMTPVFLDTLENIA
eukprot:m.152235 g.152235  ORF g.152235 m.152235 type:complete len:225 (+) comp30795_c11_seq2:166-840(+)